MISQQALPRTNSFLRVAYLKGNSLVAVTAKHALLQNIFFCLYRWASDADPRAFLPPSRHEP